MIPGFRSITNFPTGKKLLVIKCINSLLDSDDLNHCIVCSDHCEYFNAFEVKLEDFIHV